MTLAGLGIASLVGRVLHIGLKHTIATLIPRSFYRRIDGVGRIFESNVTIIPGVSAVDDRDCLDNPGWIAMCVLVHQSAVSGGSPQHCHELSQAQSPLTYGANVCA